MMETLLNTMQGLRQDFGQMAASINRLEAQEELPPQTEANPKQDESAIMLRREQELQDDEDEDESPQETGPAAVPKTIPAENPADQQFARPATALFAQTGQSPAEITQPATAVFAQTSSSVAQPTAVEDSQEDEKSQVELQHTAKDFCLEQTDCCSPKQTGQTSRQETKHEDDCLPKQPAKADQASLCLPKQVQQPTETEWRPPKSIQQENLSLPTSVAQTAVAEHCSPAKSTEKQPVSCCLPKQHEKGESSTTRFLAQASCCLPEPPAEEKEAEACLPKQAIQKEQTDCCLPKQQEETEICLPKQQEEAEICLPKLVQETAQTECLPKPPDKKME
ncbi:uncharacterized protein LOC122723975 [Manihot esculenta]|uniref:uncharacterized protein LOC122723975 n=1 Tax=Manihot esculenta TaxID=3983 RepID=UPI001CC547FB|nr:uncharacterized protein LOC122723975 [Manihot esculenta]